MSDFHVTSTGVSLAVFLMQFYPAANRPLAIKVCIAVLLGVTAGRVVSMLALIHRATLIH